MNINYKDRINFLSFLFFYPRKSYIFAKEIIKTVNIMEDFLGGLIVGFFFGGCIIGFLWNESMKGEND